MVDGFYSNVAGHQLIRSEWELLEFDNHLAGQAAHSDCRAGVLAVFAKNRNKQV
jgi:hypothetical protein